MMTTSSSRPAPKVLNRYKLQGEQGIYIGRPSLWKNIFKIPQAGDRDTVCDLHIRAVLDVPDYIIKVQKQLKGFNLICFCAPLRCHGDFLIRLANEDTNPHVIAEELLRTSTHWVSLSDNNPSSSRNSS